jgi:ArsR family transcriptional regulator, virulence genes transcriptional regulator
MTGARRRIFTETPMDLQDLAANAEKAERFLKALANSRRLMILCELHAGESAVTPLQRAVGLSQSALSQHLARLRADEMVKTRRESQTIYYSLADDNVSRMISLLHDLFCASGCAGGAKIAAPAKAAVAAPRPRKATTAKKPAK